MEAHVNNGSKQEDQYIPSFYFPTPHVSGPDIVFHININGSVYPVFVQLKFRHVLEGSDVEKALATVSSNIIQGKMVKEHEKLVAKFQVVRPDSEPELEGLERVSINIDDNNFPKIFPERHVKFIDRLKQHKHQQQKNKLQIRLKSQK
ncbi:hypothetical protein EC991_004146 [Linnemannia zychae]|nr:hypothetical protein EC991_004146 [Linnemannia zychae]